MLRTRDAQAFEKAFNIEVGDAVQNQKEENRRKLDNAVSKRNYKKN